uniref:Uncharacterized protein n=1 Tax=Setaria viridis TaxID=4556 RepID=A0A4U6UD32_SETVI|nr:hypothetical protein SEVIR_5G006266v2 [Setaria viridis]
MPALAVHLGHSGPGRGPRHFRAAGGNLQLGPREPGYQRKDRH